MANKLNERQKLFCKEYIIDLNATQAAIRAGYSKNTAYSIGQRLLKKVECQEYIQKQLDKRADRLELTADDILRDIMEVKDRCMQKIEPVLTRVNGKEELTGEYKFEYNGALKALELLGKHKKLFTDKIEIEGNIGVNFNGESNLKD